MHQTQRDYISAVGKYNRAVSDINRDLRESKYLLDIGDDESLEQYTNIEVALEDKYKKRECYTELKLAENAMLEWLHEVMKVLPQYKGEQASLEHLFKQVMARPMSETRDKILKMAVTMKDPAGRR